MRKPLAVLILLATVILFTACPSKSFDAELTAAEKKLGKIADEEVREHFQSYVVRLRQLDAARLPGLYQDVGCDIRRMPEGKAKDAVNKIFGRLGRFIQPFSRFIPRDDSIGGDRQAMALSADVCP